MHQKKENVHTYYEYKVSVSDRADEVEFIIFLTSAYQGMVWSAVNAQPHLFP